MPPGPYDLPMCALHPPPPCSFGVMLWEMYAGKMPYEGMHVAQVVMASATGNAELPWPADAPEDLAALSRSCMAREACQRPTFEQLLSALSRLEARVRVRGAQGLGVLSCQTCRWGLAGGSAPEIQNKTR